MELEGHGLFSEADALQHRTYFPPVGRQSSTKDTLFFIFFKYYMDTMCLLLSTRSIMKRFPTPTPSCTFCYACIHPDFCGVCSRKALHSILVLLWIDVKVSFTPVCKNNSNATHLSLQTVRKDIIRSICIMSALEFCQFSHWKVFHNLLLDKMVNCLYFDHEMGLFKEGHRGEQASASWNHTATAQPCL